MSRVFLTVSFLFISSGIANAMISGGPSTQPTSDRDWPAGSVELANLPSRVGWIEGPPFGGGQYEFFYQGDTPSMQTALDAFATIRAPELVLIIHDGPTETQFLRTSKDPKADVHVDWRFTIWTPRSWYQLFNNPNHAAFAFDENSGQRLPAPTMDVYVGAGKVEWSKIKLPAGLRVTDERADTNGAVGPLVRGDVFDMKTSKPIAGAKVALVQYKPQRETEQVVEGKSDDAGRFEIKDLPVGSYRVVVSADGYATRMVASVALTPNTLKRFTVRLAPVAAISGTVTDTDGKALAGVKIRAESIAMDGEVYRAPEFARAVTDEQGKFAFPALPRGFVRLAAARDSYYASSLILRPVPSDGVSLQMTPTGIVRGRLLDKQGQPAKTGNINLNPPGDRVGKWGGSMSIKPDGSFEFANVPPGTYLLSADPRAGFSDSVPGVKQIEVKSHETIDVDVTVP